jgi:hypothetical protein
MLSERPPLAICLERPLWFEQFVTPTDRSWPEVAYGDTNDEHSYAVDDKEYEKFLSLVENRRQM